MIYLEAFETHLNEIITYHGGGEEITNESLNPVIFTTTNENAAAWYAAGRFTQDSDYRGWLTKFIINFKTPLKLNGSSDMKNKWLPILDDAKIKYNFNDNGRGWYLKIIDEDIDIDSDFLYDIVYLDKFVETAKKHGYDGIIGYDAMFQSSIKIYIPLIKNVITLIESEEMSVSEITNRYDINF